MAKNKTNRPFKMFFCDRPEIFQIPPAAAMLWLYFYTREGEDRKSWPSVSTLCKSLRMSKNSILKHRDELEEHGWLTRVGVRESGAIVMRVSRGTVYETKKHGNPDNLIPERGANTARVGVQNLSRGSAIGGIGGVQSVEHEVEPVVEPIKKNQEVEPRIDVIEGGSKMFLDSGHGQGSEKNHPNPLPQGVLSEDEVMRQLTERRARKQVTVSMYSASAKVKASTFDEKLIPTCSICRKAKVDFYEDEDEGFVELLGACEDDDCKSAYSAIKRSKAIQERYKAKSAEQVQQEREASEFDEAERLETTGAFA